MWWNVNRLLICLSLVMVFSLASCVGEKQQISEEPIEILFIGNSYTFINDMPQTFPKLTRENGHMVNVSSVARGGFSLARHAEDDITLSTLGSKNWDFVVLQEKSDFPAKPAELEVLTYPAARELDRIIQDQQAETVFFMTWGYRAGLPEAGLMDYSAMQAEVAFGYINIADELDSIVAPVGVAWQRAIERNPQLELWMEDGSHPTPLGSYLAANVLYSTIFNEISVDVSSDYDGIGLEIGKLVQEVVAEISEESSSWKSP